MASSLSQRSNGYKRRMEAFFRKTDAVVQLLERALRTGFTADYVLMDSWFTQAPLLHELAAKGLSVIKLVFVRNRNKKREWLAILSTNVTLDSAEIVRIYCMRWSIETFSKSPKVNLKLGTEFQ